MDQGVEIQKGENDVAVLTNGARRSSIIRNKIVHWIGKSERLLGTSVGHFNKVGKEAFLHWTEE